MKTTDNGGTFKGVFEQRGGGRRWARWRSRLRTPRSSGSAPARPTTATARAGATASTARRTAATPGPTSACAGSKTIARIVVHPTDPDTAWVAAIGRPLDAERRARPLQDDGRRQDLEGGAHRARAVRRPGRRGDLVLDPAEPAASSTPRSTRAGARPGPSSPVPTATDGKDLGGIFKSTDGGATWRKLAERAARRARGRIGLAVSREGPEDRLRDRAERRRRARAASTRCAAGAAASSAPTTRGETWTRTSPLNPRPFYFSQIRVDPANDKRVYVLGFALHVSDDGGRTFREDRFEKVHPDNHALAIDPRNPKRLLLGTDGGAYQSYNGGEGWEHLSRMAAGEFYRINVDIEHALPHLRRAAGQPELGRPQPHAHQGRHRQHRLDQHRRRRRLLLRVRPATTRDVVYAESQQGYVHRLDLRSGRVEGPAAERRRRAQPAFRFHWNSPLIGSRHDQGVLYLAGNRVFELRGRGEQWRLISPDLSTQDPAADHGGGQRRRELRRRLHAGRVAGRASGLLWAGTDDGKLWVTENDGDELDRPHREPARARARASGSAASRPATPTPRWPTWPSTRTAPGTTGPLAYRTADGGRTWQSIAGDLPADGPVKVVREDPRNPHAALRGHGVRALREPRPRRALDEAGRPAHRGRGRHPRPSRATTTSSIATHGRSLYVLDDMRPLQELTPEVLAKDAHLFPPRPALGASTCCPGFADWAGTRASSAARTRPRARC